MNDPLTHFACVFSASKFFLNRWHLVVVLSVVQFCLALIGVVFGHAF
jgi:hypothetical protein